MLLCIVKTLYVVLCECIFQQNNQTQLLQYHIVWECQTFNIVYFCSGAGSSPTPSLEAASFQACSSSSESDLEDTDDSDADNDIS